MNEEKEASLLANWLGQPGNDPPEGLDPEVLGAVYTLRPDLGPAPRVRLDDILSGVSAGPFQVEGGQAAADAPGAHDAASGGARAQPVGERAAGVGRPSREARVPPPPTMPVRRPERAVSVPWWRRTSVGVALAAGLAVVIVMPVALLQRSALPEMVTAAPTPSAALEEAPPSSMIPEATTSPQGAPSGQPAADLPGTSLPGTGAPGSGSPGNGDLSQQALVGGDAPPVASAEADPAGPAAEGALTPLTPLPPPPPAPAATVADAASPIDRFDAERSEADDDTIASPAPTTVVVATKTSTTTPTAGSAASISKSAASNSGVSNSGVSNSGAPNSGASAYDEAVADGVEEEAGEKKSEDRRKEKTAAAAPAAEAPAAVPESTARAYTPPTRARPSSSAAASGVSASDTSASATPWDYSWSWYTSYPDVVVVYDRALAAERSGKVADAVTAYRSLFGDTRSMVAQDAAWRAARLERQRGDNAAALSLVEQGLRRSSANTVFRSNLLSLQGDLLVSLGRSADAERAWAEASRLNAARR